jgi:ribosomal protein L44E
MPNRQLTSTELEKMFAPLMRGVRDLLIAVSRGDEPLQWALRRKLTKELSFDERGKPGLRRKLKAAKRKQQDNKCAWCQRPLPAEDVILDRLEAMGGYTSENTRLLCRTCDYAVQKERGFR